MIPWTWLGYRTWRVALTGHERYETCPRATGDWRYRVLSRARVVRP